MDTEGELHNFHLLAKNKIKMLKHLTVKPLQGWSTVPNKMSLRINKSIVILILNVNIAFSSF